jgi:hypothetical protein
MLLKPPLILNLHNILQFISRIAESPTAHMERYVLEVQEQVPTFSYLPTVVNSKAQSPSYHVESNK